MQEVDGKASDNGLRGGRWKFNRNIGAYVASVKQIS